MMSTDKAEMYKNYQFTKEERKEIFDCVKEYFNLSKEERQERRSRSNADNEYTWFNWLPNVKRKFFDYMIKVESWPDEICGLNLKEMEEIYLDQNYYELSPFHSSLTYTDTVMKEYLTSESITNESRKSIRKPNGKKPDLDSSKRKQNSLLKQRLVNQRVWLNEQAHLNEASNDQRSNLEDVNYLNDNDQEYEQECNFNQIKHHSYKSTRTTKSKVTKPRKSPRKMNLNGIKSVDCVRKPKNDLDLIDFSDCDDFDAISTDELKIKPNYLDLNKKAFSIILLIVTMVVFKSLI